MTIVCSKCQTPAAPSTAFCDNCGNRLAGGQPVAGGSAAPSGTCPHCATGNRLNSRFCQQCGKPLVSELLKQRFDTGQLPAQQTLANGQGDEYFVVMLIAKGGMGAIYKVIRNRDQTVWALKEMSESAVGVSEIAHVIASFQQEAEILKQLEHPNLPKVIDSFEANGRQYMVMDFINGQTLGQLLEQTSDPLPEKQVMAWATQLCQVLDYLHNQQPPIVYRDLKPANIMVNADGEVKLIDFGIARRYKGSKKQDTVLLGTPGYAPPEQYGKNQIESDARSDVYALGATLHHLLTGLHPATSPFQFDPIEKFNSKVSLRVREGVMKALRPRPEDRLASAATLYQALTGQSLPPVGTVSKPILSQPSLLQKTNDPSSSEVYLKPFRFQPTQPLSVVEKILDEKRQRIIRNLVLELNKAEGKIIPLIGFEGVGTSYIATAIRNQLVSARWGKLDVVIKVDFSVQDGDEKLIALLHSLKTTKGRLKHRIRKAIENVYNQYQSEKQPQPRFFARKNKSKRSGITVTLPFEFSFTGLGTIFGFGKTVAVERYEEPNDNEKPDNPMPTPQAQKSLAKSINSLIEFLLYEEVKVGFIFDKLTDKDALNSIYSMLRREGISSLVILDVDRYYDWKAQTHPLTSNLPTYVPCLWGDGEEICKYLLGNTNKIHEPTLSLFAKYIEFKGQGCPGRIIAELRKFYTPTWTAIYKSRLDGKGSFDIKEQDIKTINIYGQILNAIEGELPKLITSGDDYRYDVARRQMYEKIMWMVQEMEDNHQITIDDLDRYPLPITGKTSKRFDKLHKQVSQKLVNLLVDIGYIKIVGRKIVNTGFPFDPITAHNIFCGECKKLLPPQAKYCPFCQTEVKK